MSQAPIDVKYDELLNWLLERYLIPKDWPKRLEAINVKKSEVLDEVYSKDNPEFKKIQETFKNVKPDMGYNEFQRMYQILLKTEEAKQKSLFGSYTNPVIKNADLLVNLYNKNNMHLCESSKMIIQNIGYEIPNCEKGIQYNERTINDYNNKVSEKTGIIEKNNEKLKNLFKTYSIKESEDEKQIAAKLVEKLKDLPKYLKEIEDLIRNDKVKNIISGYHNFAKKLYNNDLEQIDKEFLLTLKEINQKGDIVNITEDQKYHFITKKVEGILEQLKSSENLVTAIWNLKLEDEGQTKASSYLTNSKQRKKLSNDLNELFIFCSCRLDQIIKEESLNLTMYQNNLREINEEINNDVLTATKKYLSNIIEKLNNKEFTFLVDIFEDEKNLISIVDTFSNLRNENNRIALNIKEINQKVEEVRKEISEFNAKIQQFKKDAKTIKKIMEKFLTDNLKRKITIIGDINLI
jgi:hypothetical protein